MKKRLNILFIYLIVCIGIQAQQPMLRNFNISDYHGGTQNWCIDFTSTNRILVANNTGLLLYDSRWWRMFPLSNYSNVRSVMYDHVYDRVWSGGTNEFGCFEHNAMTFANYHSISERLPEKDKQFGEIWKIHKLSDYYIFQAKKHLFFLHRDGTLNSMSIPFTIESSAIIDGRLLVADETGIYVAVSQQLQPLPGTEMLHGKIIRSLLPYKQGQMIVCTADDGLYLYDGEQITPFSPDLTSFLHENRLFCAAIQNDWLAIGTIRNGLVLRNLQTGQTQYANTKTGLANNTVLSLRFDHLDNVWLGLDQGIAYVMPAFPTYYLLGKDNSIGTGYASRVFDNRLYLGTNQGLFYIPYPLPNTPTPPTPQLVSDMAGQVWSLTEINGTLLCGCDAGAYIIEGQKGRKIKGPEGTLRFLPLRQHPEYILGCDYCGLFLLHSADFSFAGRIKGFEDNSGTLFEDTDGSIWLSHWQKGVYRLTLSDNCKEIKKSVRFGKGNGLPLDRENLLTQIDGRILISSVDGFHYYNRTTGKLEHDDRMNKVFNTYGAALHLFETPTHDIWAYNSQYMAIARRLADGSYTVDTLTYKSILHELNLGLSMPLFVADRNQTILNSLNGFIIADNKITEKSYNTRLKIEMIETTNHGDSILYACGTDTVVQAFKIKHSDNSLRISFVMPEYMHFGEAEYSCLLENYDQSWNNWKTDNTKDYTQLPKGEYIFRVKARNRLTGFEDEQAVTIVILPAWYETWWAYTIYILLAASIMCMMAKWARLKQERKLNELRAQKEQEIRRQQTEFELEQHKKENELARLKNEQLETELKHRQSTLGDSTMNLMRKNDMLQALDIKLDELSESVRSEEAKSKITQKIREIRHEIKTNINEDEGWDKFEENFNLVYENFMKRLTSRFPDLKMNDRKLCAYLRMGLSSKEMASLLNTSVRSIETARYRLRKKLGMEQGDNLTEFIQSFNE